MSTPPPSTPPVRRPARPRPRPRAVRTGAIARILAVALVLVGLGLVPVGVARAEIYRWQDAEGRWHFAQDLNQVPARHRAQARGQAVEEGSGPAIQRYRPGPAAADPSRSRRKRAPAASAGEVHTIRVARTGGSMQVNVRLNDSVVAPFLVDTGASDVVIPKAVADQLGLDLSASRTGFYRTANGTVQQSLVTLESVDLGGAKARNVPATVSPSMSVGLLGLSFFNHFQYRVDPGQGIITLRPNGLAEAGVIRGGRSESQWRGQFAGLHARRRAIEQALEESTSHRARRRAELEGFLEEVDRQIRVLEDEADEAHVPMAWRD